MKDYEFLNNNEATAVENAEGKTVKWEYAEITDGLICTSKRVKKLEKKDKKTKQKVKAIKKQMKQNTEALGKEIEEIKRDVAKFKKSVRDGLFRDLVRCDDASERRRLVAEAECLGVME